jgi:hypothetical protein
MSSHESEQVLNLLKELSILKELDNHYESGPKTEPDCAAHRLRQQRHQEIGAEIKALAEQKEIKALAKKSGAQTSTSSDGINV